MSKFSLSQPGFFDLLPDAVFCVNRREMAFTLVNQAACDSLGYSREELLSLGLGQICSPEDIAALARRLDGVAAEEPASAILDVRQKAKNGLAAAVQWHVSRQFEQDCEYWIIVARNRPSAERAEALETPRPDAFGLGLPGHDPLTGLPDRRLFERRVDRAMERATVRNDYVFAVCFIDLDGFKAINDRHGHIAGDRVLCEFARRLVGCVRAGDMVARFGGDEFTVFLDNLNGDGDAMPVAQRMLVQLKKPVDVGDFSVNVSASIGIAMSAGDRRRIEDLLREADSAMYRAKSRGGSKWEFFEEESPARSSRNKDVQDLHRSK